MVSYGYHWLGSKQAGPIAPLNKSNMWGDNSVITSINAYLKLGLQPSQIIMGIPYYGEMWETKSTNVPSSAIRFIDSRAYKNIKTIFELKPSYDLHSNSAYYSYPTKDGKNRQIWFNDDSTLNAKYDWIKEKKIGGIGIWALGDDDGFTELWELIAEKFALLLPYNNTEQKIISPIDTFLSKINTFFEPFIDWFKGHEELIAPEIILIIIWVGIIILCLSFFFKGIKHFLRKYIKLIYIVNILIILLGIALDEHVLFVNLIKIPSRDMVLLLSGTALLGILVSNLFRSIASDRKNLP